MGFAEINTKWRGSFQLQHFQHKGDADSKTAFSIELIGRDWRVSFRTYQSGRGNVSRMVMKQQSPAPRLYLCVASGSCPALQSADSARLVRRGRRGLCRRDGLVRVWCMSVGVVSIRLRRLEDYVAILPLEIVWSRVSVLPLWTERTDIAWAVVDEAVADHFVFAFEAFAAF